MPPVSSSSTRLARDDRRPRQGLTQGSTDDRRHRAKLPVRRQRASSSCCRIAIRSCWSIAWSSSSRTSACCAIKNVTFNEPFFQGHFPGHPVMPGVLVIEALAQAGGLLTQLSQPGDGIAEATSCSTWSRSTTRASRSMVVPGDQLDLEVKLKRTHPQHGAVHRASRASTARRSPAPRSSAPRARS